MLLDDTPVRIDKKGEQLILITNYEKPSILELRKFFKKKGFSELWIPKNVIYCIIPCFKNAISNCPATSNTMMSKL